MKQMQKICPSNTVALYPFVIDRRSVHKFDTWYYKNILDGKGIMTSDQDLFANEGTRGLVVENLKQGRFVHRLRKAMVAMTNIQPILFPEGEIRKKCQFANWI